MSNLPPTPRFLQSPPSLATLINLMARAKRADEDVHNVARAMFKPGTKIMYRRNGNAYFAKVVGVIGSPGRTRLTIEKISTLKKLDVQLEDVTGIVQES